VPIEILTAIIGALATVLVGVLGFVQWWMSERARARTRDEAMLRWGSEVIDLMAEVQMICEFGKAAATPGYSLVNAAAKASALVDRGRMFFQNVHLEGDAIVSGGRGFRVAILDEVVRTYFVAKHLAGSGGEPASKLRARMWEARRGFVDKLQAEMGKSLNKSPVERMGAGVSSDPLKWPSRGRERSS
jgi:hypothetical protein